MNDLFAQPSYLLAGAAAVLVLFLVFLTAEKAARRRLACFADDALLERLTASHSPRRLWIKNSLLLLAVFLLFVALARPQWGANWEKAETRGIDLMIALDTSRSMLAEDIAPNRLERSKLAILDLLDSLQGDRIGLIAFAGNAFLQCPLTLDYNAFRQTLDAVDTSTIPVSGSNIAAAIEEAEAYFEESANERILILITDGEDLEASGLQRARAAAAKGMRILTVGVGSSSGELIPITNASGQTDFLRDSAGNPVSTRLDESTLRAIAEACNGIYTPLGATGSGLAEVYAYTLAQMPASERQESLQRIPIERYHWPLAAALVLLIVESVLNTRRRGARTNALTGPALLLMMAAISPPADLHASTAGDAAKAYNKGDYAAAMELYEQASAEKPEDARIAFNLGTAAYRAEAFDKAITHFELTLRGGDLSLQEKAFHNLGNSRVARGFALLEENPARTEELWQQALADYANALALNEGRENSRQNLDRLKEVIAEHTYTLDLTAAPAEGGTVSGAGEVFHGRSCPIEAKAAEGWLFRQWEAPEGLLGDPKSATTTARLTADASATAQFVKAWRLTVQAEDVSMGSAGKSGLFAEGEPVPIKAEAKDYFAFTSWSTADESAEIADSAAAETSVTLSGDATVTAHFVPAFRLSVSVQPEEGGQAGPSGFFEEYSVQPIEAQPREGFEWVGWVGDGIKEPANEQTTIALTSDRIAVAEMKRVWNLILIPVPEEAGTLTGGGNHPVGSTVDITATPAEGFTFEGWDGPGVEDPTSAASRVTVQSSEHTVFARFSKDDDQQDQDKQDQQDQQDQQSQDPQQNQDQQSSDSRQDQQNQQQEPNDQEDQQAEQDSNSQSDNADQQQDQQQDQQDQQNQEEQQQSEETSPTGGEEAAEAGQAGRMTPEEARLLLNALSESEKFLPAAEQNQGQARPAQPGRDW